MAGCGDDGGEAGSPLDAALGYLAEDAPLVITINTDVDGEQFKAVESIAEKFPGGSALRDSLLEVIELSGSDFDTEIKPILGNEFVVGATDVTSIIDESEDDDFVAAIEASDKDALQDAVDKEGADKSGESNGATIYEDDDGDSFAIEDSVLVVAGSRELLEAALEQRDADNRLTEDRFNEGLEDLPEDALVKVYGDIGALIAEDPETEEARKVEWVDALDTFGLTASVQEDEIGIDFNLTTEGDLGDEDLPLASGGDAPGIVQRSGEIGVGLRDLTQIVEFSETAGQAIDPSGYSDYEAGKKSLSEELGVDVDEDIFAQLSGDVSVSFNINGDFAARAELEDPARARQTLEKIAPTIPALFQGAAGTFEEPQLQKPEGGEGPYKLVQPGSDTYYFGVINDVLVVSNNGQRAQDVAEAQPDEIEGASGSVVFNVNAEALVDSVLAELGGLEAVGGQLFTGALGDLTGSIETSGDGLRGQLTLGID